VNKVMMGLKHTIFICSNGIYGCGDNCKGALGISSECVETIKHQHIKTTRLDELWKFNDKIKSTKTSWNNTFILTGISNLT
jgi:alpha-tubulin suppressor-like RCC1 family protein